MMRLATTRLSDGGRDVPVAMSLSDCGEEAEAASLSDAEGVLRWK